MKTHNLIPFPCSVFNVFRFLIIRSVFKDFYGCDLLMQTACEKRGKRQRCYNTGQVKKMKNKFIQTLGLALLLLATLLGTFTLMASAPLPQAIIATPTPRADGRIVYIVKENDTCISIALTMGISETELRDLNNLQGDACQSIYPGQELLIGIKEAETPTVTPEVPLEPTPTPLKGNGTICIYLFLDENGNALAETEELPLAGGAVSVTDRLGKINETGMTTDSGEAVCFPDIPEGDYNLSVAIPEGYNPTTVMNYALTLGAGEISTVDFGAQPGSALRPAFGGDEKPSPLLLVLGFVFIGAGIGLWFYVRRMAQ
jgi:LysM repeat protein